MATTYKAVRANAAPDRQVFNPGTDALVVSVPDTNPSDVIAVVKDFATAETIAAALNGA